jgi:hypothetical protein
MQNKIRPGKFIKRAAVILWMICLPFLILYVVMNSSFVQTYLIHRTTDYLSGMLKTKVKVGHVRFSIFKGIVLNDIYVEDLQKDTLLFAGEIDVVPQRLHITAENIPLIRIKLKDLTVRLKEDSLGKMNLQFIIEAFGSGSSADTSKSDFHLSCRRFLLENAKISYRVFKPEIVEHGINFDDLSLGGLNADFGNLDILNDDISARIEELSFKDKSGLELSHFENTGIKVSGKGIFLKDINLKTPNSSLLMDSLNLVSGTWGGYSDFLKKVRIESAVCDSSVFSIYDLSYFVPELKNLKIKIGLSGRFSGSVADFEAKDFKINYAKNTRLIFDGKIRNLPQTDSLNFDLFVKDFSTDVADLSSVPSISDSVGKLIELPEELSGLGEISYIGYARGETYNFISKGKLRSNLGTIITELTAKQNGAKDINLAGNLKGVNLEIGKILGNEKDFGQLTFNQKIDFTYLNNNKIKMTTVGVIDSVILNQYKYRNVKLYSKMNDMDFDTVSVNIDVSDLKIDFNGHFDLSRKIPEFRFQVNLEKADLKKLHINRLDSVSKLSFALNADFKGDNPDNLTGGFFLEKPIRFQKNRQTLEVDKLTFNSQVTSYNMGEPVKKIELGSDYIDIKLEGQFKFDSIVNSAANFLGEFLPSLSGEKSTANKKNPAAVSKKISSKSVSDNSLRFNINIKNSKNITRMFLPSLEISDYTILKGNINTNNDSVNISLASGYIKNSGLTFNDFYFLAYTSGKKLYAKTGASVFRFSEDNFFENLDLSATVFRDSAQMNLSWNNFRDSARYSAAVTGLLTFPKNKETKSVITKFRIFDSQIVLSDTAWKIGDSELLMDTTSVSINRLSFSHNNQQMFIDGNVSEYSGDMLFAQISNFNLNNLKPLIGKDPEIGGILNGKTRVSQIYGNPLIFTQDSITALKVNGIGLGDLYVNSTWDSENSSVGFHVYAQNGTVKKVKTIDFTGNYFPSNDTVNAVVRLTDFRIQALKKYWEDYLKISRDAQLWGKINISGTLGKPKINGDLSLKRATIKVLYTGVQYDVNDSLQIKVANEKITIEKSKIFTDKNSGYGWIKGNITHRQFDNINLDFSLEADNLMILNTPPSDSSYFYGNVYGTGNMQIKGPIEHLKAAASMKTEKNSKLFIPIFSSGTLSESNDFLSFTALDQFENVDKNSDSGTGSYGLDLDINVEMTPGAELQIIMNETSGDIMKVKGRGDMKLNMNDVGDITLYGNYTVSKGDYLFTMKNVFSKHFDIEDGGTIKWTGDPYNADLNMKAVYSLKKVSLYNLLLDPNYQDIKTKVNCALNLTGKLMNPNIGFSIDIPQVPETVTQQINSLDQDNLNKQFLSLVVLSTFQPLPGLSQEAVGGTPINTGEVLSNQINHWLSQITGNVNVGVNYQSGDKATTDEFDVALSTQLWNDRISINGNVGVGGTSKVNQSTSSTSNVVGDVDVELKLNKTGSMRMKAFNKANDDVTYDKGPYTQGVGVFWRKEFDRFGVKKKSDKKLKSTSDTVHNRK